MSSNLSSTARIKIRILVALFGICGIAAAGWIWRVAQRNRAAVELYELGQQILALNQSYTFAPFEEPKRPASKLTGSWRIPTGIENGESLLKLDGVGSFEWTNPGRPFPDRVKGKWAFEGDVLQLNLDDSDSGGASTQRFPLFEVKEDSFQIHLNGARRLAKLQPQMPAAANIAPSDTSLDSTIAP